MSSNIQDESYVWFGDRIIESNMATISALSPSARYGLSVFEGIRGYLSEDNTFIKIYRLKDHISRLFRSAERLSLPIPFSQAEIIDAVIETLKANQCAGDTYIRVDILSTQIGSWNSIKPGTLSIAVNSSKSDKNLESRALSASITSWIRIDESQMPPSIKAGANYINSRHGYLDVKAAGYDVPIFLNLKGDVAESSGACLMAVVEGELITPPLSAQILESITRESLIRLSKNSDFVVKERNMRPEELEKATELLLCGTSVEIAPITSLSGNPVGGGIPGPAAKSLFEAYIREVRTSTKLNGDENSEMIRIGHFPN